MKLTIIGGAGVRTPLFVGALLRRAATLGLREVTLMDIQEEKLALIGALCHELVRQADNPIELTLTTDPRAALLGSDFVVTTVRVGNEEGRVQDERIALRHGVLGQETTGPGGFAMALRSIPAILGYSDLMAEICPKAWLLNFTNPAGLVAQAVAVARPDRQVVGICDAPPTMLRYVAKALNHRPEELEWSFFGLNHLSWIKEARWNGEDLLPQLLASDELLSTLPELPFDYELVRMLGMIPNEYLYYFYYRERAVANILRAGITRAEQVQKLSAALLDNLRETRVEKDPQAGLRVFRDYIEARHGSYMTAETAGALDHSKEVPEEGGEGYAGVALAVMNAVVAGGEHRLVLNVPNRGAIAALSNDDVIEAVCAVDGTGVRALPVESIPVQSLRLMQQVKLYERLTVEAVLARSRSLAVQALLAHPLVGSYSLATVLVDEYLAAHRAYVGEWQ